MRAYVVTRRRGDEDTRRRGRETLPVSPEKEVPYGSAPDDSQRGGWAGGRSPWSESRARSRPDGRRDSATAAGAGRRDGDERGAAWRACQPRGRADGRQPRELPRRSLTPVTSGNRERRQWDSGTSARQQRRQPPGRGQRRGADRHWSRRVEEDVADARVAGDGGDGAARDARIERSGATRPGDGRRRSDGHARPDARRRERPLGRPRGHHRI